MDIGVEIKWGWTSYKGLGWDDGEGHKLYEGHFRKGGLYEYVLQVVRFWASKSEKAMDSIVKSGKEPMEYHDKIVN